MPPFLSPKGGAGSCRLTLATSRRVTKVIGTGTEAPALAKRLKLLRPQEIGWPQVCETILASLEADRAASASVPTVCTKQEVLDLLELLSGKKAIQAETAAKLAACTALPVRQVTPLEGKSPAGAWWAADLWPGSEGDFPAVKKNEELHPFLPRPAKKVIERWPGLSKLLIPSAASPRLLRLLCSCLETPAPETLRWASRVWRHSKNSKERSAPVREALRQLRVPGKHGPGPGGRVRLGDTYASGFGPQGEGLGEALARLFSPREPDLDGTALNAEEAALLQDLSNPGSFVPGPEQLQAAIKLLGGELKDVAFQLGLWIFLGSFPDLARKVLAALKQPDWLPLCNRAQVGTATTQVWTGPTELVPLLGTVVPVLAPPPESLADRFQLALKTFLKLEIIRLIDPAEFTSDQQARVFEQLEKSAQDAGDEPSAKRRLLESIAWVLREKILTEERISPLRKWLLAEGSPPEWQPRPHTMTVICQSEARSRDCEAMLGRVAATIVEPDENLRHGLRWLLDGYLYSPDQAHLAGLNEPLFAEALP